MMEEVILMVDEIRHRKPVHDKDKVEKIKSNTRTGMIPFLMCSTTQGITTPRNYGCVAAVVVCPCAV